MPSMSETNPLKRGRTKGAPSCLGTATVACAPKRLGCARATTNETARHRSLPSNRIAGKHGALRRPRLPDRCADGGRNFPAAAGIGMFRVPFDPVREGGIFRESVELVPFLVQGSIPPGDDRRTGDEPIFRIWANHPNEGAVRRL